MSTSFTICGDTTFLSNSHGQVDEISGRDHSCKGAVRHRPHHCKFLRTEQALIIL